MTQDDGAGKESFQFPEQGQEAGFLGQGARVFRFAVAVQAAFVADADAVTVVPLAVGADVFDGASAVYGAVARQVVMVTDVFEAAVADVLLSAGFKIKVPPLSGGGTMKDDQGNLSHRAHVLVLTAGIQAQGSGYGRGYGDDYFDDDLPNVFLHRDLKFRVYTVILAQQFVATFFGVFTGFLAGLFTWLFTWLAGFVQGVFALFAQGGFEVQTLVAEFAGGTGTQLHAFDVGAHLELFGRIGAVIGNDAAREDGQVVELHVLAVEHQFLDAAHHVGQHALDDPR